jgi:hypothetical protein
LTFDVLNIIENKIDVEAEKFSILGNTVCQNAYSTEDPDQIRFGKFGPDPARSPTTNRMFIRILNPLSALRNFSTPVAIFDLTYDQQSCESRFIESGPGISRKSGSRVFMTKN